MASGSSSAHSKVRRPRKSNSVTAAAQAVPTTATPAASSPMSFTAATAATTASKGPGHRGKSRLLGYLAKAGAQVLDLEQLAAHRGSVLGGLPSDPQPSQKMFETRLWQALRSFSTERVIYVESESKKIGDLRVPDKLMERIFTLDGLPNLQDLGKLMIGENVPECLECDLGSERGAQATIKAGIAVCEAQKDYVSRDLLQGILEDTEEHIDFLETQIDLISKVGIQNYLQSQM